MPLPRAPQRCMRRMYAHGLLRGSGFACNMGRPRGIYTTGIRSRTARDLCSLLLPPHTIQHHTGFAMAGSGIAGMGTMGRLWDAGLCGACASLRTSRTGLTRQMDKRTYWNRQGGWGRAGR
eukprot:350760-Chlamydomonas_euryale.AAC.2